MTGSNNNLAIAFLVVLGFVAFAIFVLYELYTNKKSLYRRIQNSYGQRPDREYTYAELDAISHYYLRRKKENNAVVDDITWNDLDMDRIFMLLNHTWSCIGESYLYSLLRMPAMEEEALEERNRLTEFLRSHPKEREEMEYSFAKIGKTGERSVFDYIYNLAELERKSIVPELFWIAGEILAFGSIFVNAAYGMLLFIAVTGLSWRYYYKEKKRISPYIMCCSCLIQILKAAADFEKKDIPEIRSYQEKIREDRKSFRKLKRNTIFLLGSGNGDSGMGSIEKLLLDYLNCTFHFDLIQFNAVIHELSVHLDKLEEIIDTVGMLECASAIASFRTLMEEEGFCVPEFVKGNKGELSGKNLYHPLIQDPVKNSIEAKRGVLFTGSNASGKSTFLKTVAINAILAQTVYTCMADSYKGSFFRIYTSMALRDDLESQESYFIVEIKSLKRILDAVDGKAPMLCFVDEVLRGTNTVERVAASAEILMSMEREDILCFAATHDIELTHILEKGYDNYHFEEEVRDDDVLFNYRLFKGRAVSRNAIKLLGVMGYDQRIVKRAKERAERFLETGEWR